MASEQLKYPALLIGPSKMEAIPSDDPAFIRYRYITKVYGLRISRREVRLPDGRLVEWLEGRPPPGIDGPSPV